MLERNAIYNFIKECEETENINLINFILIKSNTVLTEFCKKPYKKDRKQLLFSMTKSFTSLAIGIAFDKGLLRLDDYVISYFNDKLPKEPHKNLMKMRLSHLLTMTTGIHENTYTELFTQSDWIRAFLAQAFPHEPGTYYRYSTHATHMLSAIIEKVSGQNLEDFLNSNLFYPMEITNAEWEHSPEGLIAGGMGLSLYPSDLKKIAIMLSNSGVYNGRVMISKKYLSLATSPQVIKQDDENNSDKYFSGFQYGYQFHILPNGAYRMDGAFGQFCIIYPKENIAVIATSQYTKSENFHALIDKYFISSQIDNDLTNTSEKSLEEYLYEFSFPVPLQTGTKPNIQQKHFKIDKNELDIEYIAFSDNHIIFEYKNSVYDNIDFDFNTPVYGKSHFIKDLEIHLQEHCVYANFSQDDTLLLTVYYIETPYVAKYIFIFDEDKLSFCFKVNASMTLKGFTTSGLAT